MMLRVDVLVCRQVEDLVQTERLISGEEQLTLITESMTITSADQEKLQLLNKNTELRRLNKEVDQFNTTTNTYIAFHFCLPLLASLNLRTSLNSHVYNRLTLIIPIRKILS